MQGVLKLFALKLLLMFHLFLDFLKKVVKKGGEGLKKEGKSEWGEGVG